jgi:hypothetical protein
MALTENVGESHVAIAEHVGNATRALFQLFPKDPQLVWRTVMSEAEAMAGARGTLTA